MGTAVGIIVIIVLLALPIGIASYVRDRGRSEPTDLRRADEAESRSIDADGLKEEMNRRVRDEFDRFGPPRG